VAEPDAQAASRDRSVTGIGATLQRQLF